MLKGKNINLRLVREKDLERMFDLGQDLDARGEFFPVALPTEATIRKRFAEHGYWGDDFRVMLIVDREEDLMRGLISVFKPVFYQDSIELGYILYDVSCRGKGYMTEAVQLMTGYMFRLEKIYRVQIQMESANVASRRVAEKAGFKHEGTLRHAIVRRCVPVDAEMYGMTRADWEAQSK